MSDYTKTVDFAAKDSLATVDIDTTVGPVIIPNLHYYQVQAAVGTSIVGWAELR